MCNPLYHDSQIQQVAVVFMELLRLHGGRKGCCCSYLHHERAVSALTGG